jgi:hypothetical protein
MTDAPAPADQDILPIAELSDEGDDLTGLRRWVPVLSVVVAALLAVGLAIAVLRVVNGDDRTPAERLNAAPAAAEAAKTFAYQVKTQSSLGTFSTSIQLDGVVDNAAKRGQATMDVLGRKVVIVTDGTAAFVQVPAEARGFSQGKGWIKVPTDGVAVGAAGASPTASPLETFRQLQAVGAEIEDVGNEDVRGTSTTHFRTRLDLSKLPNVGPLADQLEDVPVDVWLDDQDRPRRYRFVMTAAVPGQPQKATVTTTIESFDYGKPVDVEVPDPADVADLGAAGLSAIFGGAPTGS